MTTPQTIRAAASVLGIELTAEEAGPVAEPLLEWISAVHELSEGLAPGRFYPEEEKPAKAPPQAPRETLRAPRRAGAFERLLIDQRAERGPGRRLVASSAGDRVATERSGE